MSHHGTNKHHRLPDDVPHGLFSVEYNDPWQFVGNVIETAIGFLILGILALIYLLGLIPNPFPWMLG